ncbi:MAG: serine/threonine-protein kinase [Thermoanaerobaculaceae bacterium]|nr:serine/threonine-protein kinase [Thermoanaerobaculaceae bacterium]TAM52025.1 MAG: serine/threonine protein kinase [Acidobacteriota bacterium]
MTAPHTIGRFVVTGELGRGAMGVVYRASDPALDRQVAVKVISARPGPVPVTADELEARFLREARVAARIAHPGVVTVFDAGREADSLYLVMELVDGESLGERLGRREFPSAAEAFEMAAQVADALAAAHALGVVHRDIKPGNIMVTRSGRVKVADFGVAKAIGEDTNLTRTGTVVGSPAYMAPEQVRGAPLDGRADLFSLGVVLYELLLQRKPFPADTVTTLIYQILHEDPLADPDVSRAVGGEAAAFLRRCLAKAPADRIPDAASFAAGARALVPSVAANDMERTAPTAGLPSVPASVASAPVAPVAAPAPRRFPVEAVLVVSGLALLGAAALVVVHNRSQQAAPPLRPVQAQADMVPVPPKGAPPPQRARARSDPDPVRSQAAPPQRTLAQARVDPARPMGVAPTAAGLAPVPTVAATPTRPPIAGIFYCRRGADFNVSPEDAIVTVDGTAIGKADDWDNKGGGKTYVFARPGRHLVKLTLAGYRTTWIEVVAEPSAKDEVVDVDTQLPEQ